MEKRMNFFLATLVITIGIVSCSKDDDPPEPLPGPNEVERVDTLTYTTDQLESFTFVSDGVETEGLIYLPEAYATNDDLPTIYLIDYQESHFTVITDEFAQVINAVREMPNFDALVVTTEAIPNINAVPGSFQEYIDVYIDMASHVVNNYTENTSRTLIARGSEGGVVLLTLLNEDPKANVFENYIATDSPGSFNDAVMNMIQTGEVSENMLNKKLHYSYTSSANQPKQEQLVNSIGGEQYPWLSFTYVAYWSGEFNTAYPQAYAAGLEFVFN